MPRVNTHELLKDYWGTVRYQAIAKYAAGYHKESGYQATEAEILEAVARTFWPPSQLPTMRDNAVPVRLFGEPGEDFDAKVMSQIYTAAKLPVATQAAVMPDAHPGYALPIGGVIGLENAVSPYFVGFDIACRMHMTILDIDTIDLLDNATELMQNLIDSTSFGVGVTAPEKHDHPVMYHPLWDELKHVGRFKSLAWSQLGTSGSGNHFADLVTGKVIQDRDWLPIPKDRIFAALITHSGSRGFGHKMATYYSKLAQKETERRARGIHKDYAWLGLDTEAGQEYWEVMHLAGLYAQANHQIIHSNFLRNSGLLSVAHYENHHNFAWKQDGLIVHRKGATPAQRGVVGIIPGSMGTRSFLVEGKGNKLSLHSSAHGAGRLSSRTQAKKSLDHAEYEGHVRYNRILTHGVADDETYQAYKDIEHVMDLQQDLVETIAYMFPKVVVMGGDSKRRR